MNKVKLLYIFFITATLLCVYPQHIYCQQKQSNKAFFNKSKWKEVTQDSNFDETFKERKKKEKKESTKDKKEFEFEQKKQLKPLFNSGAMKLVLIVLIIGILAYIIFVLLKNSFNIFSEKVPESKLISIVDNLEDNIHDADFDNLLKQAINDKQFKLAVRIFYLHTIKTLSDKDLITWKKDKTNGQYVREMLKYDFGMRFSVLTNIYENAWFSSHTINEENYGVISELFNKFIEEVN